MKLIQPHSSKNNPSIFAVYQRRYFYVRMGGTLSAKWEDQENDGLESGSDKRQDILCTRHDRKWKESSVAQELQWKSLVGMDKR